MNKHNLTPEAIYKFYRQTRTEHSLLAATNKAVPKSIAEQVYQRYQETRSDDREESIDVIMSFISNNDNRVDNLAASRVSDKSSSDLLSRELLSWFSFPGQLIDKISAKVTGESPTGKLFKAPTLARFALPSVVAGLLVITLLPSVFKPSESSFSLPTALKGSAVSLAGFIDNNDSIAFGLAAQSDGRSDAFNRGTLSVDLSLAVISDNTDVINGVLNKILLVGETIGSTKLTINAQQLQQAVNSAPTTAKHNSVQQLYSSLQAQLTDVAEKSSNLRWLAQGQAMESILLASRHALNTNDTQAMQQALQAASNLDINDLDHPSVKLIGELQAFALNKTLAPADIRKVISKTENVKILMQ